MHPKSLNSWGGISVPTILFNPRTKGVRSGCSTKKRMKLDNIDQTTPHTHTKQTIIKRGPRFMLTNRFMSEKLINHVLLIIFSSEVFKAAGLSEGEAKKKAFKSTQIIIKIVLIRREARGPRIRSEAAGIKPWVELSSRRGVGVDEYPCLRTEAGYVNESGWLFAKQQMRREDKIRKRSFLLLARPVLMCFLSVIPPWIFRL